MSIYSDFRQKILTILEALQEKSILSKDLKIPYFSVEPPRDEKYGDISTNIALILSKAARMNPRDLSAHFLEALNQDKDIQSVQIAGAGFINLTLSPHIWFSQLRDILSLRGQYGHSNLGKEKSVNIEYVSANPTGPLHVGHVRGAVFGDALANLMAYVGYNVTKEYYINDAGSQIDTLAQSVYLRYQEALGQTICIPEGLYPGEYLIDLGQALADRYGEDLLTKDDADRHQFLCEYAPEKMMDLIRQDLKILDIHHDVYTSEKKLVAAGGVDEALKDLNQKGFIYEGILPPPKGKTIEDWEARPQTLFKASDFGDDVDRPLKKSDGGYTYFATDIAYHYDKFKRGADLMVNIWGADHGGYVKRIHAAIAAISDHSAELQVKLCQIVHLFKDGEPYKMSKRAGTFVTLRDITDQVGTDAVRFMMLGRKNDAQLDFDFKKVTEQTKDNPVFYVQYAYARIHSVFQKAILEAGINIADLDQNITDLPLERLTDVSEKQLIQKMATFPRIIEQAAEATEPHRIAFYLYELSSLFHAFWNKGKENQALRFIILEDLEITKARLCLIRALSLILKSALDILGVTAPEKM